jgi:hypothetical protein
MELPYIAHGKQVFIQGVGLLIMMPTLHGMLQPIEKERKDASDHSTGLAQNQNQSFETESLV